VKYLVTIEGRAREVVVHLRPDGGVSVTLDGAPVEADVVRVPGGVNLRIDGRVYDVVVGGEADQRTMASGAARAVGIVESERALARKRKRGGAAAPGSELRAPMPGRIVKILVAAGDAVEAGAPVMVMEAMKMENELRAEGSCVVDEVKVSEGENVEGNTVLVTFVTS
jgi:biotin carboxyl carrier protein